MTFSQIGFKVDIQFHLLEKLNATKQEKDACMHDFGFPKQNIDKFSKSF